MKKLLISSLKVFLLECNEVLLVEMSFNNFTQFSYISSVIISLEVVLLNFRPTFGENLVLLFVQQCSNLCISDI